MKSHLETALSYARGVVDGTIVAGTDRINACRRFLADLERDDLELRTWEPDFCVSVIETMMVHRQGQAIDGTPLLGRPFELLPWEVFVIYNLAGFYWKKTGARRYAEAFIFLPRKNGKTAFTAATALALALLDRASGSIVYIVAAQLKQAQEAFEDIRFSLEYNGLLPDFRVRNNNAEHSIHADFRDDNGRITGSLTVEALASNPKKHDSLNAAYSIVDELHAVSGEEYNRFKEAGKAYTNKLCMAITTGGDDQNSFCYRRLEYSARVCAGEIEDDSLFAFICRADQDEKGNVDYLDPLQHEKANPSYGVTIRPEDMMAAARQAMNEPQQRGAFLSRSLNIYTTAMRAWFNIGEVRASDGAYNWTLEELAHMGVDWYGGADLSRLYDLTAAALYGSVGDVDVIIPHAFFPRVMAAEKADKDGIPLFGWEEDGWLTMCNTPTVNAQDVVAWFREMKRRGFRIRQVGHDRKFAGEEYIPAMKKAGFKIIDQPQYYYVKSQGFRHIEKKILDGKLYYVHAEPFEYCIGNVRAIERTDDAVQYEKIQPERRIDVFDAAVFACIRKMEASEKVDELREWYGT